MLPYESAATRNARSLWLGQSHYPEVIFRHAIGSRSTIEVPSLTSPKFRILIANNSH